MSRDLIVTLPHEALRAPVTEALRRAGGGEDVRILACPDPDEAAARLAEAEHAGGRGVPVLDLSADAEAMLAPGTVTLLTSPATPAVNVAVPALRDPERARLWGELRTHAIEDRHRLVEVEVRADAPALAAAEAAGTLAARMAAADARWREETMR